MDFVTPKRTKPQALPPSRDETYIHPPLGRSVITKEVVGKVTKVKNSDRLRETKDLSSWFPERPYFSVSKLVRELDHPFTTGRSMGDSFATGRGPLDVLENGLRRYGW